MFLPRSFHVQTVPQVDAAILTPVSATYGSLEFPKLAQLGSDLARFRSDFRGAQVIVDLSGIKQHGSGFLNELIEFATDLRRRDIPLVICGDRSGLVQIVGGSAWCVVATDLVAALEACAPVVVAA